MSFEATALRLAQQCGLIDPEFFNGSLFCKAETPMANLDRFQVEFGALSLGITKVTKGAVEHSIDFVA